jgi:hypothetical protein
VKSEELEETFDVHFPFFIDICPMSLQKIGASNDIGKMEYEKWKMI